MKRYGSMIAVCVGLLVCAAVYVYSAEEGKMSAEAREEFLKNFKHRGLDTTRGDAMMLRILVEGSKAKRGVEVGTFVGFGAMNMGIGFERTGGHLYTLEINPKSAAEAKANLTKLGLDKTVTVIEGDALKTLSTLEGEFDFVFLDAAKNQCGQYLKLLEPKLKPGAIVAADNVIKSAADMKDFLDYVENSPNYDTVTIRASMEKQDGMTVSYKKQ